DRVAVADGHGVAADGGGDRDLVGRATAGRGQRGATRARGQARDRRETRGGVLADELLPGEQRDRTGIAGGTVVEDEVDVGLQMVTDPIVGRLERCEAVEGGRQAAVAGAGIVVNEPDDAGEGEVYRGGRAAVSGADRVGERVRARVPGRRVVG